ncbi:hypothetical protein HDU77_007967 [Chytriomyces hyalinus]|nr:hypothetical protein HDU77_007967 [Chytriomyces hyalinus]
MSDDKSAPTQGGLFGAVSYVQQMGSDAISSVGGMLGLAQKTPAQLELEAHNAAVASVRKNDNDDSDDEDTFIERAYLVYKEWCDTHERERNDEAKTQYELYLEQQAQLKPVPGSPQFKFVNGWRHFQKKQYAQAMDEYMEGAAAGNPECQCELGAMHMSGLATYRRNEEAAAEYYRLAANQGLAKAQFNFALCCTNGWGVPKNESKAVQLYRAAADQGFPGAEYEVGMRYVLGKGVPEDESIAARWFERAGNQGHAMAQTNLGIMYFEGAGVEKNIEKSLYWYRKAAKGGSATAQNNLGDMFENANGVDLDLEKAKEYYKDAALNGHTRAGERLVALGGTLPSK